VSSETGPADAAAETVSPPQPAKERYGLEVIAVLGVSFGMSGLYSLLSFIRSQVTINKGIGFSKVQTTINKQTESAHQWLDILDSLADILNGVLPALLVIVLLMRSPGGRALGIGLDRLRVREIAQGAGFAAAIGIPGLALVYFARKLGLNAQLVVTDFPDVWYRIPVLLLDAVRDGVAEELVVCAYLLTRLRQMGWSNSRALTAAAILRGSYHLYQGYGGFIGNAIMGLIFGWFFQRTRRVWPLIIAHSLIDAISFIGYIYLHDRVSWL
jgi:membrane protease YdiL (CAAX protease family)